jgi:type II secretory pathway pseudopilin PulG
MEGNDVKQVLALKYIIRRIVAILVVAAVVAIPAIYGARGAAQEKAREQAQAAAEAGQSGAATGGNAAEGGSTAGGTVIDDAADLPEVSVGTVLMYAGDEMPDGFLRCDGSQVSRDAYKDLYAVIGDKYGAGDGESTFNLPNMRTLLPVEGSGDDVDVGEGERNAPTVAQAIPAATAFRRLSDPTGPPPDAEDDAGADGAGASGGSGSDDSAAEDTRTAVMYFIIKY